MPVALDKIVSLCKRRGFIFQNSEVYGGLANTWDYGSIGVELKKNIKEAWWKAMVYERDDMEGLDSAIFNHPRVWEASGHIESFVDPLVDCKGCKKRFRADDPSIVSDGAAKKCPECGGMLTEPRKFNLMFRTFMGPVEEDSNVIFLRPETAQGIFVNFINIMIPGNCRFFINVTNVYNRFHGK
jgi:glycyl-tRNA synthetase